MCFHWQINCVFGFRYEPFRFCDHLMLLLPNYRVDLGKNRWQLSVQPIWDMAFTSVAQETGSGGGEGKGQSVLRRGVGHTFVLPIPSQTKWGTDSPYSGPDWLHKSFFSPETPPSPVQDSGKWTKPYPNTRGQMVQSMIFNFRQRGLSKRVRDVACTPL